MDGEVFQEHGFFLISRGDSNMAFLLWLDSGQVKELEPYQVDLLFRSLNTLRDSPVDSII